MKYFFKKLISTEVIILFLVVIFIFILSCFFFGENISNVVNLINKYPRVSPENGVLINQQDSYIIHLGYLGSFLQGSIGLIVSIVIMFTVFITFSIERRRVSHQRFEDRFFKLLQIHRENVHEMNISHKSYNDSIELSGRDSGNKVILSIVRELLEINKFIYVNENILNLTKYRLTNKERLQLSYIVLFFGLGKRSNKVAEKYLEYLTYKINIIPIIRSLTNKENRIRISKGAPIKYKSVGGHQTRLGHYFRNLFFCIKVIDENNNLSHSQKLDYVKHVRVQLNTYEQILLLVNSLTFLGCRWEKYIVIYQLLRNIPYNMLDKVKEFSVDQHIYLLCQKYSDDIYKIYKMDWEVFYDNYFEFNDYPKLKY